MYIYGAQMEALPYSTSYIPTSGSSVTRNQDVCNNGGSLDTINSTEGTLYAEIAALSDDGTNRAISINNGSLTDYLFFRYRSNNQFQIIFRSGNSNIVNEIFTLSNNLDFNKIAFSYKLNEFKTFVNGLQIGSTITSGVVFGTAINSLDFDEFNGTNKFFGKTKALAVWKEALSDEELAELTYPTPTDPTFSLDFDTIAEQFTFARGSEATYVDAQGLIQSTNEIGEEEVTNGSFDTDSNWSTPTGWEIIDGKLKGTNVNAVSTTQAGYTFLNKSFKVVYTVSNYVQGDVRIYLGGSQPTPNRSANGTYTEYITITSANTTLYIQGINNFTGSIDNVSVKEVISATNTPRLDYSTGAEAFLLEPQSTNLITYSEDFSQSYWNKSNVAIDFGYLSPEGNDNAYRVEHLAQYSVLRRLSTLPAGNTTLSVWLKRIDGNSNYNFYGGGGSKSITITDEWKRYDFSFVADGTNNTFFGIQDPNPSGFGSYYIYGAQVEAQSFATSYIPSNGSQTTRNQETCINATPEINSEEGVLYAELAALSENYTQRRFITLNDGTSSNAVIIRYETSGVITARYQIGGVAQCQLAFATTITDTKKIAFKYSENDFALWVNGVEVATDLSGNVLGQGVLNNCDFNSGNGTFPFFGNTKDIQVYPKALSDAELIKLTTI
jgi:hypothetical protein